VSILSPIATWLTRAAGVAFLVSLLSFFMMEALPDDIAFQVAAARYDVERVSPEVTESVRSELGLHLSTVERLRLWFGALLNGELGRSFISKARVVDTIGPPLLRTFAIVALAWPATIVLGVVAGIYLGRSARGVAVAQGIAAVISSIPTYVLGLGLVFLLAVQLRWLPSAGYGGLAYLALPVLTLALRGAVRIALITAASINAAYTHPSIAFARMKGLREHQVALLHAAPLAAPAVVACSFFSLASLLEGVAVIEVLFAYPGMGKLLVDSVMAHDVPVVQAIALTITFMVLCCNTAADLLARHIDPSGRK